MDARCITLNNEAVRIGSERLLSHLRSEGLNYDLWVTGTDCGSTVHLRVDDLTDSLDSRIRAVLVGTATMLDLATRPHA
ncbi:hypothetical protein FV232_06345 [Methylobacterium sp. WL30]|uniref:hypothetical protein n=1 Tax=unclassified Methylobacterium TaxID=2615210 RepID=UPI0011C7B5A4|nr:MULTISPECIES: hypothetical protein [unclassified Methylobacterium]TXM92113.1 hypothetical protein FV223_12975 [Methylobacterium sp. WL116]TXN40047.1 hypothetical protein FV225_07680 [Methylobacterium sp. WL93]TXN53231.1 hypothetical protein FV227_01020 [Methylobacterium sp. WL119]TXN69205.1 hypothetical protein FV232_06345 [Methylobacterium sp. WL30]